MDKQQQVTVYFAPGLSEEELTLRLQAIRLIDGVERIETQASETLVPGPEQAYSSNRRVSVDQSLPRSLIEQALIWGVNQGLISTEQIHSLESEQLVQSALSILDQMPEDLKRQMGQDFERYNQP